ncbi:hypothetical protein Hanom_Chr07g00666611 [Helianthus anomalus]
MTTASTTHSFLQGILTVLIIYLTLLWVTQYLICLGKLFKLKHKWHVKNINTEIDVELKKYKTPIRRKSKSWLQFHVPDKHPNCKI